MPRGLESAVSSEDIQYLKACGILAPDRWPEAPAPTQAESMWGDCKSISNTLRSQKAFLLTRQRFLDALEGGLDSPEDGPKL